MSRKHYCIYRCTRSESERPYLHRFPHPERRPDWFEKWVAIVGDKLKSVDDKMKIYKNMLVCDNHFKPEHKLGCHRLVHYAVPSLYLNGKTSEPGYSVEIDHNYVIPRMWSINTPSPDQDFAQNEQSLTEEGMDVSGDNMNSKENIILDFGKTCRACMTTTPPFHDLFVVSSPDEFKFCTSIEVSETDNLPRLLCQSCVDLLNKIHEFKHNVINTDTILRKYISEGDASWSGEGMEKTAQLQAASPPDAQNTNLNPQPADNEVRRKKVSKLKMNCPKCPKTFIKYEIFEAHMRAHFGKQPDIECSECHKRFSTAANLRVHARVHTGARRYQCPTCGKKFAYLNVLRCHERAHAAVKAYKCAQCGAGFMHPHTLKQHMKIHSGKREWECALCGLRFSHRSNLAVHARRHSGLKPHACALCDKRFAVKGDLAKHMLSHSDARPFQCASCGKSFKTRLLLTQHNRTHTDERPYKCDVCAKGFRTSGGARVHRMRHTGERPHRCPLCARTFLQKGALNRHLRTHERAAPPAPAAAPGAPAAPQHVPVNVADNILEFEW